MSHPLVVHCKKDKFDVYVGRPTKWGNHLKIGTDGTREEVVEGYRQYLLTTKYGRLLAAQAKQELKGKVLACWCAPEACHADVLAEIANS